MPTHIKSICFSAPVISTSDGQIALYKYYQLSKDMLCLAFQYHFWGLWQIKAICFLPLLCTEILSPGDLIYFNHFSFQPEPAVIETWTLIKFFKKEKKPKAGKIKLNKCFYQVTSVLFSFFFVISPLFSLRYAWQNWIKKKIPLLECFHIQLHSIPAVLTSVHLGLYIIYFLSRLSGILIEKLRWKMSGQILKQKVFIPCAISLGSA